MWVTYQHSGGSFSGPVGEFTEFQNSVAGSILHESYYHYVLDDLESKERLNLSSGGPVPSSGKAKLSR
jgi:hypothetical protein